MTDYVGPTEPPSLGRLPDGNLGATWLDTDEDIIKKWNGGWWEPITNEVKRDVDGAIQFATHSIELQETISQNGTTTITGTPENLGREGVRWIKAVASVTGNDTPSVTLKINGDTVLNTSISDTNTTLATSGTVYEPTPSPTITASCSVAGGTNNWSITMSVNDWRHEFAVPGGAA